MAKEKSKGKRDSSPDSPPPTIWRKVRENAEAVIIAIILALIIRHYSLEAFEIPTGSMAPGLYGVHIEATCPNCETVDAVGLRTDSETNKPQVTMQRGYIYEGPCPTCGMQIREGVTAPNALIECPRDGTQAPGTPEHYRPSKAFAKEHVQCSECTYRYWHTYEAKETVGGHKILVNKFAYEGKDPERWQVIVFKFNRQRNYIKRLVGLPGETILVKNGDIYINGEIERKPMDVQEQMWFPIHDTKILEAGLVAAPWFLTPRVFTPLEETGGAEFNAIDGFGEFRYTRPVLNTYSYNRVGTARELEIVRDTRALVDLRVNGADRSKAARVWVDLRNGPTTYRLALPIEEGTAELLRVPSTLAKESSLPDNQSALPEEARWSVFAKLPENTHLDLNRDHEVDFSWVDRQLRVFLDGKLLLEMPSDPADEEVGFEGRQWLDPSADAPELTNDVAIRVRHCGGLIDRVRLFRDLHYTRNISANPRHAVDEPFQIHEQGFFAMGDNSPSSLDSRAWGALSRQNLLGRGFAIFWPALPWRFEAGFIH